VNLDKLNYFTYETFPQASGGVVGLLRFNRPEKLNALNLPMGLELQEIVSKLNTQDNLHCVLLGGHGSSFSAGGDLDFLIENTTLTPPQTQERMRAFYDGFLCLYNLKMPLIGLLHGYVTGAALGLSLACDYRLSTDNVKLAVNFVKIGLTPGMGNTFFLPRLLGPAVAYDLMLSGRTITGLEAKDIGLVLATAPTVDDLIALGLDRAQAIASAAPLTVRETKRLLRQAMQLDLDTALNAEAFTQSMIFNGAEIAEGLSAVKQKRSPQFKPFKA
jgi:enoyl-CoA hydratase